MCGRFALYTDPHELAEFFSATLKYDIHLSYNIAPSLIIPGMIAVEGERFIVPLRWGLIPSWYKEGQKLAMLNNAKSETIDIKPAFRHAFRQQRCLILTDGFYEWDSTTTPKQPYFFQTKNKKPFAMAGIWERWISPHQTMDSCCIITKAANEIVTKIHDRMPVLVPPEKYDQWLDNSLQDVPTLKHFFENNAVTSSLITHPVSTRVNNARYDDPECINSL